MLDCEPLLPTLKATDYTRGEASPLCQVGDGQMVRKPRCPAPSRERVLILGRGCSVWGGVVGGINHDWPLLILLSLPHLGVLQKMRWS
jgi:hypothetical protein